MPAHKPANFSHNFQMDLSFVSFFICISDFITTILSQQVMLYLNSIDTMLCGCVLLMLLYQILRVIAWSILWRVCSKFEIKCSCLNSIKEEVEQRSQYEKYRRTLIKMERMYLSTEYRQQIQLQISSKINKQIIIQLQYINDVLCLIHQLLPIDFFANLIQEQLSKQNILEFWKMIFKKIRSTLLILNVNLKMKQNRLSFISSLKTIYYICTIWNKLQKLDEFLKNKKPSLLTKRKLCEANRLNLQNLKNCVLSPMQSFLNFKLSLEKINPKININQNQVREKRDMERIRQFVINEKVKSQQQNEYQQKKSCLESPKGVTNQDKDEQIRRKRKFKDELNNILRKGFLDRQEKMRKMEEQQQAQLDQERDQKHRDIYMQAQQAENQQNCQNR